MGRPHKPMIAIEEIAQAFEEAGWPPVLNVVHVAEILHLSTKSVYDWHAKGRFKGAVVKRGKHLLFFRNRLIDAVFNGKSEGPNERKQ